MRAIILAAGQGFKMDGFNKIMLKDPKDSKTILQKYIDIFGKDNITVVVGYNATSIMNEYPELDYVYNQKWRTTGSSYSLSLALNGKPCFVLSSDLIMDKEIISMMDKDNCVLVGDTENRTPSSINCTLKEGKIVKMKIGEGREDGPEMLGIIKITDNDILHDWKKACQDNPSTFAGLNLPFQEHDILAINKKNRFLHEINTPLDYINLLKLRKIDRK